MEINKIAKLNKKKIARLCEKYKLNYLVLFGSRADKTARKGSDFDIAYSGRKELTNAEEVFLAEDLARVFKSSKINLVNVKNAGPLLAFEISKSPVVLAEAVKNSFDNFQIYAFMQYIEAKPLFKMQSEYIEGKLRVK